jgi:hypothetical protein
VIRFWPPSSSGLGRRPFTAVARVRIPLGVRATAATSERAVEQGPVAQLVSAPPCHGGGRGFESRQGRQYGEAHVAFRPGSSVGTSVRLKSGRSPVRSRPWPPKFVQFIGKALGVCLTLSADLVAVLTRGSVKSRVLPRCMTRPPQAARRLRPPVELRHHPHQSVTAHSDRLVLLNGLVCMPRSVR